MARLKKLKKGVIIFIITSLFIGVIGASFVSVLANQDATNHQVTYSIDEYIKTSINNNRLLQSLEYALETKKIDLQEKKSIADKVSESQINNLELAKVKHFLPYDAEIQLEIAKLNKEEEENKKVLEAVSTYIDFLKTKRAIEVLEGSVERAREQVDVAKLNYKLGLITKVDVLSSEYQLEKVKSELKQVKNNLEIKKMKMNQMINQDISLPIQAEMFELENPPSLSEEEVALGLEYSLILRKHHLELNSMEKLLEITGDFYPKNTYAYRSVLSMLKTKESVVDEATTQTQVAIISQQLSIQSLKEKQEVMKKQVEKMEETYRIMFYQYKAGLISYQDLASADQLLQQTKLEELQAMLDYYTAIYQYKYMIGTK